MAATCSEKQNKIKTKKSDRACALECCSDTFWLVICELIAKRSHFFTLICKTRKLWVFRWKIGKNK